MRTAHGVASHVAQHGELAVKGILFNHVHPGDRMEEDNVAMCQERTGLPVLALVQDDMERFPMDGQALAQLYDEVK